MNQVSNLSRQRFGLLEVLRRAPGDTRYGNAIWLCRCCCGREVPVRGDHLVSGKRKSCGFNCRPTIRQVAPSEYAAWLGTRNRCYNKQGRNYANYGGRGICVCNRWKNSFENFLSDMGPKLSPKHTLDRYPDNNGNYEPGNCRWATAKEQMRNTRNTIYVESGGERIPLIDLTQRVGVSKGLVLHRLRTGWSLDEALLTPPKKPTDSRKRQRQAKLKRWRTPKIRENILVLEPK